jgi:LysM domain
VRAAFVGTRLCVVLSAEELIGLALRWAGGPLLHGGLLPSGDALDVTSWTLGHLVVTSAVVAAWLAFGFLLLSTLMTVLLVPLERDGAPMPTLSRLTGPAWWRRALVGACGLSLAAPVAAHAAPHHAQSPERCAVTCRTGDQRPSVLAGLAFPDLPDAASGSASASPELRTVRPGDSLWRIAREELAPNASDSAVCGEVAALYVANRELIGPDPDLILPGTHLTLPGGTS